MSEQDLVKAIITALNMSGMATVWRNHSGQVRVSGAFMHLAPKGTPDIVGFSRFGTFVGFEVKLPKEQPKEWQLEFQDKMDKAGCIAAVVRTPQEALDALKEALCPRK